MVGLPVVEATILHGHKCGVITVAVGLRRRSDPAAVPAHAHAVDPAADRATRLAGVRVLRVEGNLINRELATVLLQRVGAEVAVAEHGRQALEILA